MSLSDILQKASNSISSINGSTTTQRVEGFTSGLARNNHPKITQTPSSGKNLSNTQALKPKYQEIHDLRPIFANLKFDYYDTQFKTMAADLYDFIKDPISRKTLVTQTNNATNVFNAIHNQMANILDVKRPNDYKLDNIEKYVNTLDLGDYSTLINKYISELKLNIVSKVEKIKKELLKLKDPDKYGNIVPIAPDRNLSLWSHDLSVKYIRPDNNTFDISSNLISFVYSMDYDVLNMPIFTMDFILSDANIRDMKNDFENIVFLLSVLKFDRNKVKDTEINFIQKVGVFDNHELIPLNPKLPSDSPTDGDDGLYDIPRHRIRLDFVTKKSANLNVKFQSKVFNDCTVLDVINSLLTDVYQTQKDNNTPERELIKYTISPPDNTVVYEQIILDPGTLSQVIMQIQETYGVYRTGIRIFFESLDASVTSKSGIKHSNIITIKDKGGIVPAEDSISDLLFEVLDSRKTNDRQYDSGSLIDAENKILIVRTQEPYLIEKNNSYRYTDGEAIRMVNTSQNNVYDNNCDMNTDKTRQERIYWNSTDNQYALNTLQDTLREKEIIINCQAANIDVFSINDNYKAKLVFYNKDNSLYSNEYRLSAYRFNFEKNNLSVKDNVVFNAQFRFMSIPKIQVNGAEVKRDSYNDRISRWKNEFSFNQNNENVNTKTASFPSVNTSKIVSKINPKFAGRLDYNGKEIPVELDGNYQLSKSGKVTLKDIYILKDGSYPDRLNYFCQDYDIFCYAQKFANEILDPLISMFGKVPGAGGKFNSFYRYHRPSNGSSSSMHLWGLAADGVWAAGTGDLLADSFNKIVNSNLDYDQVILEGNGSEYRWIHIALNINSNNRKQALISLNGQSGNLIKVKKGLSIKDLAFNNVMKTGLKN